MYNVGQKVRDLELGLIGTIKDEEYQNGWYYFISFDNGSVGYRYEYEIESIDG